MRCDLGKTVRRYGSRVRYIQKGQGHPRSYTYNHPKRAVNQRRSEKLTAYNYGATRPTY